MKISLYPTLLFAALAGSALPAKAASDTVGAPVSVAKDTYTITVEAKNGFMRDEDVLRADASKAASKFCDTEGKTLKVVSIASKMPTFSTGYGWAKITFMALNPGDPILSPPPPAVAAAPGMPATPMAPPPPQVLTTDEMYTQLLKLDDLRKKGILTQEEFDEQKKKVLSHTQ